jgi:hypothetical protein
MNLRDQSIHKANTSGLGSGGEGKAAVHRQVGSGSPASRGCT